MNINWKKKLTSRKLWLALVGVVIGAAMIFGVEGSEIEIIITRLSGAVTAVGSILGFIGGEATVDAARENSMNFNFGTKEKQEDSGDDTAEL